MTRMFCLILRRPSGLRLSVCTRETVQDPSSVLLESASGPRMKVPLCHRDPSRPDLPSRAMETLHDEGSLCVSDSLQDLS